MTVAYATWAFVPDSILHPLGISYYPDRYWTYAAPLYMFLAWVFSIIVYFAYNFINTAPIDSYYIITDEKARDETEALPLKQRDDIPPIADVPITTINEILFPQKKTLIAASPAFPTGMSFSQGSQRRLIVSNANNSPLRRRDHTRQHTS